MRTKKMKKRKKKVPSAFRALCACAFHAYRAADDSDDNGDFSEKMQKAFLMAMGKAPKEFVHVDMQEKMLALGLKDHFPSSAYPPPNAVREVATKLRKLKRSGLDNPFVAVDLRKYAARQIFCLAGCRAALLCICRFLPPYCTEHIIVKLPDGDDTTTRKKPDAKKGDAELSLASWLLAWDGYGLAAAMLEQLTFESTVAHKHQALVHLRWAHATTRSLSCWQVMQIAYEAPAEGHDESLGVIYDRLVRYALQCVCTVALASCM